MQLMKFIQAAGRLWAAAVICLAVGSAAACVDDRPDKDDLAAACLSGSAEEVRRIVGSNPKLVNQESSAFRTPLMSVAFETSSDLAAEKTGILLAAGADPNQRNSVKNTAVHEAVRNGHAEMLRLLIAAGAEVNVVNGFGDSPLNLACLNKADQWAEGTQKALVETLLGAGADYHLKGVSHTPLEPTRISADLEVMEMILEARGLPNDGPASYDGSPPPPRVELTISPGYDKEPLGRSLWLAEMKAAAEKAAEADPAKKARLAKLPLVEAAKSSRILPLPEAALLSDELAEAFEKAAAADNRIDQLGSLDRLLYLWALQSGLAPTVAERVDRPGVEIYQFDTPRGRVPWARLMYVAEAWRGHYLLDIGHVEEQNTRVTIDLGDWPRVPAIKSSYDDIRWSVHRQLAFQTRLKPILDLIVLDYSPEGRGKVGDLSKVEAHFEKRLAEDPAAGLFELLDFMDVAGEMLKNDHWRGPEMAARVMAEMETSPELKAVYEHFDCSGRDCLSKQAK